MIKNHVTSLELSKQLDRVLPEKYKSEFYWIENDNGTFSLNYKEDLIESLLIVGKNCYRAFLSSELGEILPGNVNGMFFIISKGLAGNLWYCAGHRMSDSKEVCAYG